MAEDNRTPHQEHSLFQGLSDNQKAEAHRLMNKWDHSTFPSVEDSVAYHYGKHGKGGLLKYLNDAANFNKKRARLQELSPDRIRYNKANGEFIIVNTNNGKIVSYGKNR
jgi:hypothetical protein